MADENKNRMRNMTAFGGDIPEYIEWDNLHTLDDFPPAMRLTYDDINPSASSAHFICYCDKNKIPMNYIIGVSGYDAEFITGLLSEAKETGVYEELANTFKKQK